VVHSVLQKCIERHVAGEVSPELAAKAKLTDAGATIELK